MVSKDKNIQEEAKKNEETKAASKDKSEKSKSTSKSKNKKADNKASKIEEMGTKLAELNDKHLRLQAEFDNYRKRTLNEKIEMMKSAGEDILSALLPVMDNFERAITASKDAKDVEAVKEGIQLIYNSFKEYLNKKGVKEIEAMHQAFNTDFHEALTKIPAPEEDLKGKVVDVIEKGYILNEKVIRYSKVVVGE